MMRPNGSSPSVTGRSTAVFSSHRLLEQVLDHRVHLTAASRTPGFPLPARRIPPGLEDGN
jgi:hypothetical protein